MFLFSASKMHLNKGGKVGGESPRAFADAFGLLMPALFISYFLQSCTKISANVLQNSKMHLNKGSKVGGESPRAFADELHRGCVAPARHPATTTHKNKTKMFISTSEKN